MQFSSLNNRPQVLVEATLPCMVGDAVESGALDAVGGGLQSAQLVRGGTIYSSISESF
jgi:hypothetical protein